MWQSRDTVLLNRANKQFGLLKDVHLIEAGVPPSTTSRWVQTGRLTRKHPRVYVLGHTALTDKGRWLAAAWACGDGAVLSHLSAAAFHGLRDEDPESPIHVTTTESVKSREGIVVHRVRHIAPKDIFRPHPLLVTTVPRMLVDLGDVLSWDEYRAVADKISELRLDRVKEAQDRAPGRRGAPLVTRLIEADDAHTKSEFERRYLRFCDATSLPRPDDLNLKIAGHKADCIYHRARLVVELDGRAHHERRAEMREDRRRDRDYQRARYRVARLVWDDLHTGEAAETADGLREFLQNP